MRDLGVVSSCLLLGCVGLVGPTVGCNALFGVDDLTADETSAGGSSASTSSTTSGGGGTTPCEPGETRSCYGGPPMTDGVGTCQAGVETCAADGSAFGGCEGEVLPEVEDCTTPADESCDGHGPCGEVLWAEVYGGGSFDEPRAIAVDDLGRSWVATNATGAFDLQGVSYPGTNVDGHLHRFDLDGSVSSHLVFTGFNAQTIEDVAVQGGDLIVVGRFGGQLVFDGNAYSGTGGDDMFVARIGENGTAKWLRTFGGPSDDQLLGVAADAQGITVVGTVRDIVDFGGGPRDVSPGEGCVVLRLDPTGDYLWDYVFSASNSCQLTTVDQSAGLIHVGGSLQGFAMLEGMLLPFGQSGLLLGFSSTGSLVASRILEGTAIVQEIVRDGSSLTVTGSYQGVVDFGAGPSASQDYDVFVARYEAMLGLELLVTSNDPGASDGYGVALAPDGDILLAGAFEGDLTLAGANLAGDNDESFVMRMSSGGELRWARTFTGPKEDLAHRVAPLPDGTPIAVGRFIEQITLDQPYLAPASGFQAWVARLTP